MDTFQFPKWTNHLRNVLGLALLGAPVYGVLFFLLAASPKTLNVGYQPVQPIPFSHKMHAGDLGMDCRYCHTTVETANFAAVPPTQTCMNCHERIRTTSEALAPLRKSAETGMPIRWVKVHDLPDHVYFDHSAHVTRGVSCVSCHGRVDRMDVVRQVMPLSMGWCLDCHRNPAPNLRPVDKVTDLAWEPTGETKEALGARLMEEKNIKPSVDCSTCHR